MTQVTTILGKQVGVQFQGTQDRTNLPTISRQSNLLMVLGDVPRGRLDSLMSVTLSDINAKLGYQQDNLEFQAVQDALNTGVPAVTVVRAYTKKTQ